MSEKLQKVLARAAFGSRREIETWIIQKRIRVNGKIAQIGDRVSDADQIFVDGKRVSSRQGLDKLKHRYLLYNKNENENYIGIDTQITLNLFENLKYDLKSIRLGQSVKPVYLSKLPKDLKKIKRLLIN